MTDTVVIDRLSKIFYDEARGAVQAVNEVSFTCRDGEIFALLGANGAGKTTTLRMLSTVLSPSGGSAAIMGHDVVTAPEAVRRCLGFYSASTALYPRLTGRETLELFARVNGYPAARVRERVKELVERFEIGEYADTLVQNLSQGMKQKIAIARTIVHDPPVIIFDEPTVGLDVLNALELQQIITELRSGGKTVILSTHIMSEAEKLSDRIAIIHRGTLHACATLAELRAASGLHYLEEIFVHLVRAAEPGGETPHEE